MTSVSADAEKRMNEINKQLQDWVKISHSTVKDSKALHQLDPSLVRERTQNLLTVSKSLRTISEQVRNFAETARQQSTEKQHPSAV